MVCVHGSRLIKLRRREYENLRLNIKIEWKIIQYTDKNW